MLGEVNLSEYKSVSVCMPPLLAVAAVPGTLLACQQAAKVSAPGHSWKLEVICAWPMQSRPVLLDPIQGPLCRHTLQMGTIHSHLTHWCHVATVELDSFLS